MTRGIAPPVGRGQASGWLTKGEIDGHWIDCDPEQQGKESEFEGVFTALAGQVRANEPGNKLYQLFKSRKDARTYVVMEIYQDQAALDAHGRAEYFKAAGPKVAPTMAGRPEILYFDSV